MTGELLVVVLAVGAGVTGRVVQQRRRLAARERRRRRQLPEALERMAGALRTGSSLTQALADAGDHLAAPLGRELAELTQALDRGEPLLTTLDRWTATHDDVGTRLAATALALATQVGATPARAIDGVAVTLRERITLSGERHAQATQARTSAVVLSVAPLGFTGLLLTTNDAAAGFLLTTPLGWGCLAAGLGLDGVGAAWMARLTRAGEL